MGLPCVGGAGSRDLGSHLGSVAPGAVPWRGLKRQGTCMGMWPRALVLDFGAERLGLMVPTCGNVK